MVSALGARLGYQTSYQFCAANCALGTPRGGRRTVPMRSPSSAPRALPSRTTRITMASASCVRVRGQPCRSGLAHHALVDQGLRLVRGQGLGEEPALAHMHAQLLQQLGLGGFLHALGQHLLPMYSALI
eukprot:Opistho-2@27513